MAITTLGAVRCEIALRKGGKHSVRNENHPWETGIDSVTVSRLNRRTGRPIWDIDCAIRLISNMELVLDDCHLRHAAYGRIQCSGVRRTYVQRENGVEIAADL